MHTVVLKYRLLDTMHDITGDPNLGGMDHSPLLVDLKLDVKAGAVACIL